MTSPATAAPVLAVIMWCLPASTAPAGSPPSARMASGLTGMPPLARITSTFEGEPQPDQPHPGAVPVPDAEPEHGRLGDQQQRDGRRRPRRAPAPRARPAASAAAAPPPAPAASAVRCARRGRAVRPAAGRRPTARTDADQGQGHGWAFRRDVVRVPRMVPLATRAGRDPPAGPAARRLGCDRSLPCCPSRRGAAVDAVRTDLRDGVLTLTIDRPDAAQRAERRGALPGWSGGLPGRRRRRHRARRGADRGRRQGLLRRRGPGRVLRPGGVDPRPARPAGAAARAVRRRRRRSASRSSAASTAMRWPAAWASRWPATCWSRPTTPRSAPPRSGSGCGPT